MAGALQRYGQPALVLCAGAGPSAPLYPAAIGDETSKLRRIFVVDRGCLVDAERADLAPAEVASPASTSTAATPVPVVAAVAVTVVVTVSATPLASARPLLPGFYAGDVSGRPWCPWLHGHRWRSLGGRRGRWRCGRILTRRGGRWHGWRSLGRRRRRSLSGRILARRGDRLFFFVWTQATSNPTSALPVLEPLPGRAGRRFLQAWPRLRRDLGTELCLRLLRSCTA